MSTFNETSRKKASLSELIASIERDATVRRSWPKIISLAISSICGWFNPSKRSAAFDIIDGSVDTPIVNVEGTVTRMFCDESACSRLIRIVIGFRSKYA